MHRLEHCCAFIHDNCINQETQLLAYFGGRLNSTMLL